RHRAVHLRIAAKRRRTLLPFGDGEHLRDEVGGNQAQQQGHQQLDQRHAALRARRRVEGGLAPGQAMVGWVHGSSLAHGAFCATLNVDRYLCEPPLGSDQVNLTLTMPSTSLPLALSVNWSSASVPPGSVFCTLVSHALQAALAEHPVALNCARLAVVFW